MICQNPIELLGLYVMFSHFRARDILMGIFLLFFHKLCEHLHVLKDDIWKKLFFRVASHDVKWENKTYKLKRSVFLLPPAWSDLPKLLTFSFIVLISEDCSSVPVWVVFKCFVSLKDLALLSGSFRLWLWLKETLSCGIDLVQLKSKFWRKLILSSALMASEYDVYIYEKYKICVYLLGYNDIVLPYWHHWSCYDAGIQW